MKNFSEYSRCNFARKGSRKVLSSDSHEQDPEFTRKLLQDIALYVNVEEMRTSPTD